MKKRILAAVLTVVMIFSSAACGQAEQSAVDSSDNISSADNNSTDNSSTDNSSTNDNSSNDSNSSGHFFIDATRPEHKNDETGTESKDDKPQQKDFTVKFTPTNAWEEDGRYCGGYEVVIKNTGNKISSWTAKLAVPDGFKITNGWNGSFKVSGTTLTISNAQYNGEIDNGKEASFGFNFSSPEKIKFTTAEINGKSAGTALPDNTEPPVETTKPIDKTPVTPVEPKPVTDKEDETSKPIDKTPVVPAGTTPVAQHGKLSIKGTNIVDKNGKAYQLVGMSTHGIGWFPDFVNKDAFKTLRDDWNTNVIRLAMYTGSSEGYNDSTKKQHENLVRKGIDICIELGMYVVVDWHVLADQTPMTRKADAIRFFNEISREYADCPNIIYEICNEPNGSATWSGVIKPYAQEVIPVIRKNDPDSIIIVGTPTWSQDIDQALSNPLKYDNIMYALHFYSATHTDWLRQRLETCIRGGLPVFVSEFGCCDASGNGGNDFAQTKKWLQLLDKHKISYCNWNLANKNESSSAFKPSAGAKGNWSVNDLSESGAWMRDWFRKRG